MSSVPMPSLADVDVIVDAIAEEREFQDRHDELMTPPGTPGSTRGGGGRQLDRTPGSARHEVAAMPYDSSATRGRSRSGSLASEASLGTPRTPTAAGTPTAAAGSTARKATPPPPSRSAAHRDAKNPSHVRRMLNDILDDSQEIAAFYRGAPAGVAAPPAAPAATGASSNSTTWNAVRATMAQQTNTAISNPEEFFEKQEAAVVTLWDGAHRSLAELEDIKSKNPTATSKPAVAAALDQFVVAAQGVARWTDTVLELIGVPNRSAAQNADASPSGRPMVDNSPARSFLRVVHDVSYLYNRCRARVAPFLAPPTQGEVDADGVPVATKVYLNNKRYALLSTALPEARDALQELNIEISKLYGKAEQLGRDSGLPVGGGHRDPTAAAPAIPAAASGMMYPANMSSQATTPPRQVAPARQPMGDVPSSLTTEGVLAGITRSIAIYPRISAFEHLRDTLFMQVMLSESDDHTMVTEYTNTTLQELEKGFQRAADDIKRMKGQKSLTAGPQASPVNAPGSGSEATARSGVAPSATPSATARRNEWDRITREFDIVRRNSMQLCSALEKDLTSRKIAIMNNRLVEEGIRKTVPEGDTKPRTPSGTPPRSPNRDAGDSGLMAFFCCKAEAPPAVSRGKTKNDPMMVQKSALLTRATALVDRIELLASVLEKTTEANYSRDLKARLQKTADQLMSQFEKFSLVVGTPHK